MDLGRYGVGMVAIVTGARRGLGRAIADALKSSGIRVIGFSGDITDPAAVATLKQVNADILINNAARYEGGTVEDTPLDTWNYLINVNLTGAFLVTQAVLPGMIKRGYGRIVNIGSYGGVNCPPGSAAYNVSKAGLIGLTKATASENVKHGITCNMIAPGAIDTGIYNRFVPLSRPASTDEIVNPVRWLISEGASYLTGQIINVNGGIL